jgi:hypothetical protein
MTLLAILLAVLPVVVCGEESYFFTIAGKPSGERIEGNTLHIAQPIHRIEPPEASSIIAFHQGLGPGREYKIQVNLRESPEKEWMPMLKLGGEIIMEGVTVARPNDPRFASSFSLESDNPEAISRWCQLLREVLKVPGDRVQIDLTEAEPDGAGQAATASESKSEDNEKLRPASEARSR